MKAFLIVGAKRAGKTTTAKKLARSILARAPGMKLVVWDRNKEWGAKTLPDIKTFSESLPGLRDSLVVIEDATIHFDNRRYSSVLQEALVTCRHNRVSFVLLFHSMRSVPPYIMDQIDGMIIHKTRDNPALVAERFGEWAGIVPTWEKVMRDPFRHASAYVSIG